MRAAATVTTTALTSSSGKGPRSLRDSRARVMPLVTASRVGGCGQGHRDWSSPAANNNDDGDDRDARHCRSDDTDDEKPAMLAGYQPRRRVVTGGHVVTAIAVGAAAASTVVDC
jgi:hypothetical protein